MEFQERLVDWPFSITLGTARKVTVGAAGGVGGGGVGGGSTGFFLHPTNAMASKKTRIPLQRNARRHPIPSPPFVIGRNPS